MDPEPYQQIIQQGHEILNHSYTHPFNPILSPNRRFDRLPEEEMRQEIVQAQTAIRKVTGFEPTGFRSPHFLDTVREFRILAQLGFRYCSSVATSQCTSGAPYLIAHHSPLGGLSYCTAWKGDGYDLLMIPLDVCPEHSDEPFSTYHTIRRIEDTESGVCGVHQSLDCFLELWSELLELAESKRFLCVYFDPLDITRDEETMAAFEHAFSAALVRGWQYVSMEEAARIWRQVLQAGR